MDISPVYWGRGAWAIIFTTIYHYYKDFDQLMYYLEHFYIPCRVCRENLSKKKNDIGFKSFSGANSLRKFYIDIYNDHHSDKINEKNLSNLEV